MLLSRPTDEEFQTDSLRWFRRRALARLETRHLISAARLGHMPAAHRRCEPRTCTLQLHLVAERYTPATSDRAAAASASTSPPRGEPTYRPPGSLVPVPQRACARPQFLH